VSDVENESGGRWPHCPQLGHQVGWEGGEQVEPPPSRWREQKGGGQKCVGWPHDRRCRGRQAKNETNVRSDVVADTNEERCCHSTETGCTPRACCSPGCPPYDNRCLFAFLS